MRLQVGNQALTVICGRLRQFAVDYDDSEYEAQESLQTLRWMMQKHSREAFIRCLLDFELWLTLSHLAFLTQCLPRVRSEAGHFPDRPARTAAPPPRHALLRNRRTRGAISAERFAEVA